MSTQPTTLHDVQPDGFFTRGLAAADAAVFAGVEAELEREQTQIELIASENIVSKAVLEAQGSVFTNKYAEGYPGKRYYQGCAPSDVVETLAIECCWRRPMKAGVPALSPSAAPADSSSPPSRKA